MTLKTEQCPVCLDHFEKAAWDTVTYGMIHQHVFHKHLPFKKGQRFKSRNCWCGYEVYGPDTFWEHLKLDHKGMTIAMVYHAILLGVTP